MAEVTRGEAARVGVDLSKRVFQVHAVDRLGHAWSGGAAGQPFSDALGPDASRLAWAFVSKVWAQGLP